MMRWLWHLTARIPGASVLQMHETTLAASSDSAGVQGNQRQSGSFADHGTFILPQHSSLRMVALMVFAYFVFGWLGS